MSDAIADHADPMTNAPERRPLFDRLFPIGFGLLAIALTAVWFAAIGWIAWQPVHFLFARTLGS